MIKYESLESVVYTVEHNQWIDKVFFNNEDVTRYFFEACPSESYVRLHVPDKDGDIMLDPFLKDQTLNKKYYGDVRVTLKEDKKTEFEDIFIMKRW